MSKQRGLKILLYLLISICYLISWTKCQSSVTCPAPPGVANGRARSAGPYYNGTELVYDCDDGYVISGNTRYVCFVKNENSTQGEFRPLDMRTTCELPTPLDYRQTINNTYEGVPDWLAVLSAILLSLLFLMMLACMGAAMWFVCCRGAGGGAGNCGGGNCFGRGSSGMTTSHMYNTHTTSNLHNTGNDMTSGKPTPTLSRDAGTQVRLHQSGGDYDYGQKHNATYTKVEYVTHGEPPSTSGAKQPVWMPHARPPRNDVYHNKSITK